MTKSHPRKYVIYRMYMTGRRGSIIWDLAPSTYNSGLVRLVSPTDHVTLLVTGRGLVLTIRPMSYTGRWLRYGWIHRFLDFGITTG